ncbi:MAG: MoxR family ATPase [Spirochaetales bacterium]|uniref:MoxR family ATPase n=1 Tax=Candidatus Thalassospirochaeta sargassi TaxID=3119039 RepID=A0AAJ1IE99_9SPIO|nr:MoxR family ATPase [Spirochaetales bacterium]
MTDNIDVLIEKAHTQLEKCRTEIASRVIGQSPMIDGILMGLLAGGHVLIEGVPGLAKTLAVKTVSEVIDATFSRIQFTPDLLPADIVGTMIYKQQGGEFVVRKGPVFANIVLADEINRAPAKVQSALLEAMQERQVTIGSNTHRLPDPFFVLATQNPIESEGTYPLPEAQLDRFILKLKIDYPTPDEELEILRRMGVDTDIPVKRTLSPSVLRDLRKTAEKIKIDDRIEEYIVTIVAATRETDKISVPYAKFIEFGASPRASIYLYRCAKIQAMFEGRSYVIPDDVKTVVHDVMRHRIVLSYEAESEELTTDDVIDRILKIIPVP